MKKSLIFAAAAMIVFAACSKNEVAPVADGSNAISYTTVASKPGTKAPISGTAFPTDKVFGSYAFHLGPEESWPGDRNNARPYIDNDTIKYFASASAPYTLEGWHSKHAYYWPKDGTLTFFSYSFGKGDLHLDGTLTCTAAEGLKITDYDVTGANNLNNDFMVANIQKNKTKGNAAGAVRVPTEFKHALTQIVGINVLTNAPHHTPIQAGDKEISVESIEIYGISQKADFSYDEPGNANYYGTWSNWSTKTSRADGVIVFRADDPSISTSENLFTAEQKLFIPQTLTSDAKLRIVYNIKSIINASGDGGTNRIEKILDLNTANTGTTGANANTFAANKAVTYNITINFDGDSLIYWSPTIVDWDPESYSFAI